MNIVELKNEFDKLSFNLIREYTNLEKKYIDEKDKNTKDLTQVNSINESMVTTLEQNDLEISDLYKQISCKDQIIESLENDIKELKIELEETKKQEDEKNRFNMLKAQSDEIIAKSREIERLNKIIRLRNEKDEKDMKIQSDLSKTKSDEKLPLTDDLIITPSLSDEEKNIEVTIEDVKDEINYEKELNDDEKELNDDEKELNDDEKELDDDEKELDDDEKELDDDEKELDDDEKTQDMSDEEVSYSVIKYRKVEYYIDECIPPNVFEITEDEDVGKKLGTWEKNSKGKMTINKNK